MAVSCGVLRLPLSIGGEAGPPCDNLAARICTATPCEALRHFQCERNFPADEEKTTKIEMITGENIVACRASRNKPQIKGTY
jgi:hypothetical protein